MSIHRHLFFCSHHGICELTKTGDQGFPVHPASTKRYFGGFLVYWIRRVLDSSCTGFMDNRFEVYNQVKQQQTF